MKKTIYWVLFSTIVVCGLLLRVVKLDEKVLHNDEANQMVRAGMLQTTGTYEYDLHEHHGPTLYYLSMPISYLTCGRNFSDTSESTFKLVPALFGVGVILLMLLLREGLGWGATLMASLLTAVSTCMVYYSRFYIQETLLVFFTFGAIACGWRYFKNDTAPWAVATGVFIGLMHATKETCIIAFGAFVFAFLITVIWQHGLKFRRSYFIVLPIHTLYMILTAIIVSVILYSSFFTNIAGVWDSIATYGTYFERGAGVNTDHTHPFYYYLQILVYIKEGGLMWSEALILLLGLVGAIMVLIKAESIKLMDTSLCRFILIYTLLMTFLYSQISYKTPWCMMSFLHGWILLAGIGTMAIFDKLRYLPLRAVCALILALMVLQLSRQTIRASFRFAADHRNPYAYAHTVTNFLSLVNRINDIADISESGRSMKIAVITNQQDAWPLPWYTRDYDQIGFWNDLDTVPADFHPAIIVASTDKQASLSEMTEGKYQREYWGLRPEVPMALFIRNDLWQKFMATRAIKH